MYDPKLLRVGLSEYKASLEKHINSLNLDFKQLEARWIAFDNNAEGDYVKQFRGGWRVTQNKFKEYINQNRAILALLDKAIEDLIEFASPQSQFLTSSVKIGAGMAILGLTVSDPVLTTMGANSLLTILQSVGGGHKSIYRKARRQFLLSLLDDPKAPKYVRGWIKQELNRISPYSHNKRKRNGINMRGIPGFDVGHKYPQIDLSSTFRLEYITMNRSKPHKAKRRGLPPSYY
jgi:hypothetical protein